jgi:hypothetical protein
MHGPGSKINLVVKLQSSCNKPAQALVTKFRIPFTYEFYSWLQSQQLLGYGLSDCGIWVWFMTKVRASLLIHIIQTGSAPVLSTTSSRALCQPSPSCLCYARPTAFHKPVLHTVRSSASAFNFYYPIVFLRLFNSCLLLPPRFPVTYILSFTFPLNSVF